MHIKHIFACFPIYMLISVSGSNMYFHLLLSVHTSVQSQNIYVYTSGTYILESIGHYMYVGTQTHLLEQKRTCFGMRGM